MPIAGIHLLHHTHVDIGYTDLQTEVARQHVRYIMVENGLSYLSVAPNAMVSKPIPVERPFWWVGPRLAACSPGRPTGATAGAARATRWASPRASKRHASWAFKSSCIYRAAPSSPASPGAAALPGVAHLKTEIRLWAGLPRIDVEVRLDKQPNTE